MLSGLKRTGAFPAVSVSLWGEVHEVHEERSAAVKTYSEDSTVLRSIDAFTYFSNRQSLWADLALELNSAANLHHSIPASLKESAELRISDRCVIDRSVGPLKGVGHHGPELKVLVFF